MRERAARDWCAWEDAVVSLERTAGTVRLTAAPATGPRWSGSARTTSRTAPGWRRAQLLRDAGRLAGIPGVLIHGRLDLGSPLDTAWALHRAWPGSQLQVVEGAGHFGTVATRRHLLAALDDFAAPPTGHRRLGSTHPCR